MDHHLDVHVGAGRFGNVLAALDGIDWFSTAPCSDAGAPIIDLALDEGGQSATVTIITDRIWIGQDPRPTVLDLGTPVAFTQRVFLDQPGATLKLAALIARHRSGHPLTAVFTCAADTLRDALLGRTAGRYQFRMRLGCDAIAVDLRGVTGA